MALLALRDPSPFVGIPPGLLINTGKGLVIRIIWAFISSVFARFIGVLWSYMVIFGYVYEWCVWAGNEHVYTNMILLFYSAWSLHFRGIQYKPQVLDKSHLSLPISIELGTIYLIFPSGGWTSLDISGTSLKHGTWRVRSESPKSGRWIKQNKIYSHNDRNVKSEWELNTYVKDS